MADNRKDDIDDISFEEQKLKTAPRDNKYIDDPDNQYDMMKDRESTQ